MVHLIFQLGIGVVLVTLILAKSKPAISPSRVFIASLAMGIMAFFTLSVPTLIQSVLTFFVSAF